MKTKISAENPFGHDRYGYAWQKVPQEGSSHLDFGCFRGRLCEALKNKGVGRIVGADVSQDAIEDAEKRYGDLEFVCISGQLPLPFEDRSFSSVTVLDVIEHVVEQIDILKELGRILKDDGILIVTVPGRHLFSFLDMGNFKFYFPGLHKWYYCRNHSQEKYDRRYVSNPDGLIGDVSAEKGIHEHFSRPKMENLLNISGFKVIDFDGSGFFGRLSGVLAYIFRGIKPLHKLLQRITALDAKMFKSTNLFCTARKIG